MEGERELEERESGEGGVVGGVRKEGLRVSRLGQRREIGVRASLGKAGDLGIGEAPGKIWE